MNADPASIRTPVAGMLIAGRFQLVRMLGQGGMGSVWVARHTKLNVEMAVKFIDPEFSGRAEILSRFEQEAMAAAHIKSPHVVQIFDHGIDERGRAFIAMELLKGEDLGTRLARVGTLSLPETIEVIRQAARGLSKAHAAGIVHRDIKPENLFLVDDEDGTLVKVLDFGIAKAGILENHSASHKTAIGQLLGTPAYMSPEQTLGRPLSFQSDLYSLAVVAYRCVTGREPFQSESFGELIVAVSTMPAPPPSSFCALPEALDPWFERALQKDPTKRFPFAKAFAETFAAACNNEAMDEACLRKTLDSSISLEDVRQFSGISLSGRAAGGARTGEHATISAHTASAPPLRPTRTWIGALVALGIVGAGAAAVALRPGVAPKNASTVPSTPSGSPTEESWPRVMVRVAASPQSATLFWDGQPLGQNPFSGSQPRDGKPHTVRAEAAGYQAEERIVVAERGISLVLTLAKHAEDTAKSGDAPRAAHAAQRPVVRPVPAAPRTAASTAAPAAPTTVSAAAADDKPRKKVLDRDDDPWK